MGGEGGSGVDIKVLQEYTVAKGLIVDDEEYNGSEAEVEVVILPEHDIQTLDAGDFCGYLSQFVYTERGDIIARQADVLAAKYQEFVRTPQPDANQRMAEDSDDVDATVKLALDTVLFADKSVYFPTTALASFYDCMFDPRQMPYGADLVQRVLQLDQNNKKLTDSRHWMRIEDRLKEDIVRRVVTPSSPDNEAVVGELFSTLVSRDILPPVKLQEILLYAFIRADTPESQDRVIAALASNFPTARIEQVLRAHSIESPGFAPKAEAILQKMRERTSSSSLSDVKDAAAFSVTQKGEEEEGAYEGVPEEMQQLLREIARQPEGAFLVTDYIGVRKHVEEAAENITRALGTIQGTELIAQQLQQKVGKQLDQLLTAWLATQKHDKAMVSVFGELRSFSQQRDVEEVLRTIKMDMIVLSHPTGNQEEFMQPHILRRIDRYLFTEKEHMTKPVKTLILEAGKSPGYITKLLTSGILETDAVANFQSETPFATTQLARAELPAITQSILPAGEENSGGKMPDMIIVHLPLESAMFGSSAGLATLQKECAQLPPEQRPLVVVHTDNFPLSVYRKEQLPGFLFCSDDTQLTNIIHGARDMLQLRTTTEDSRPDSLAVKQKEQYDASLDLREWEHKTADTYQSLKHLLAYFKRRDTLLNRPYNAPKRADTPLRRTKTILDCGTGEGRISGMLARVGYNVIGLDISPEMLNRAKDRITAEGQGLRGELEDTMLAYPALQQLEREGMLPEPPILDDKKAQQHLVTVEGDFFNLQKDVGALAKQWKDREKDIDPLVFFDIPWDENQELVFDLNVAASENLVDAVTFNWHTFREVGKPNQGLVLEQAFNLLQPGGSIVLEIADRGLPPYVGPLQEYHTRHPNQPFGTLQDEKPEGGEYSPRYFPDANELVELLRAKGFDIDPQEAIQTYFIQDTDEETGEKKLAVKEYFITARKPSR